ncbi:MAG: SoxR reducing system RseC family protein, partial [Thiotrichaceae bacterium]|nr:SoxR reducing system RseC family protein [Thiotrichaceae bacterium]
MIEEQAIVVNNEGRYVWVNTQRQSSCGQCSVKNGCGTQVLAKVLGNKIAYVRCLNTLE